MGWYRKAGRSPQSSFQREYIGSERTQHLLNVRNKASATVIWWCSSVEKLIWEQRKKAEEYDPGFFKCNLVLRYHEVALGKCHCQNQLELFLSLRLGELF